MGGGLGLLEQLAAVSQAVSPPLSCRNQHQRHLVEVGLVRRPAVQPQVRKRGGEELDTDGQVRGASKGLSGM